MVILIGTKGQLIKMAGVMLELKRRSIDYLYVQTDQQPSFNRVLEEKFGLKNPDLNLRNEQKDLKNIYEIPIFILKVLINAFNTKVKLKNIKF